MKIEIPEKKKLVYEMRIPIRWGDMDAMGHVNHAVYLTYFEQARFTLWWAQLDFVVHAPGGREALEAGLPDFQPIGRAIEPIEIAHSVAFLLSDHSTAITGTAFVVDGGVLAGA